MTISYHLKYGGKKKITFSLESYNRLRAEIKSLEGIAPSVSVCKTCHEEQKDSHPTSMLKLAGTGTSSF